MEGKGQAAVADPDSELGPELQLLSAPPPPDFPHLQPQASYPLTTSSPCILPLSPHPTASVPSDLPANNSGSTPAWGREQTSSAPNPVVVLAAVGVWQLWPWLWGLVGTAAVATQPSTGQIIKVPCAPGWSRDRACQSKGKRLDGEGAGRGQSLREGGGRWGPEASGARVCRGGWGAESREEKMQSGVEIVGGEWRQGMGWWGQGEDIKLLDSHHLSPWLPPPTACLSTCSLPSPYCLPHCCLPNYCLPHHLPPATVFPTTAVGGVGIMNLGQPSNN